MKFLTVLSGLFLCGGGAFCFYFSTNAFSGMAFVLGVLMAASGVSCILSYALAARGTARLPETVLTEGLFTILLGFAVLNDQVGDLMITSFFGIWLAFSGATRLSESLAVSRHSPRDWAKIIPIAIINMILGTVMVMQDLISAYNPVTVVGLAFVLDGLSLLIYALYMKPHIPKNRELEAKARADAKQAAAEAKRAERDALRKLSRDERETAKAAIREHKQAAQKAKREAELAEKEKEREARKATSDTIEFTPEETAQIIALADAQAQEQQQEPEQDLSDPAPEVDPIPEDETEAPVASEDAPEIVVNPYTAEPEPDTVRPVWHRPVDIPSLRNPEKDELPAEKPAPVSEPKLSAVNLEAIEDGWSSVEFEPVELPEPELSAEGGEAGSRKDYLEAIDQHAIPERAEPAYQPLTVEDLIPEQVHKSVGEAEKKDLELRLTTEFSFQWPKKE